MYKKKLGLILTGIKFLQTAKYISRCFAPTVAASYLQAKEIGEKTSYSSYRIIATESVKMFTKTHITTYTLVNFNIYRYLGDLQYAKNVFAIVGNYISTYLSRENIDLGQFPKVWRTQTAKHISRFIALTFELVQCLRRTINIQPIYFFHDISVIILGDV